MWFLNIKFMKIMEFDLKWVHMARYELILKLDGALWLTISSKKNLTHKTAMEGPNPKMTPRRGAKRGDHLSGKISLELAR